ncbi:hypothetical protein Vqi01_44790 [Micromonospora qiuiae]|uniref:Helix-turn-helix domain-containing protein n=1 Tax=Micromonospora qiuiae TaxID=502268 RepID=A0ABQ4JIH7_9ACTN|nr:helix-turn-helix domain-containing protein [Micromonospora qiuiae]GIJ29317.1 hypothetical protein Vqi01_44790 [Micromonospora qiuiae]
MSLEAIGALREPARRAVYEYVVGRAEAVSRNEVAEAVGIGRTLAAFHLDKLAEAGLLETAYAPRSGGPGAGRPAKLYRRSAAEHAVTLPPRDYRLLAEVLAEAVERAGVEPAAYAAAHEVGAKLAGDEVVSRLRVLGYERARRPGRRSRAEAAHVGQRSASAAPGSEGLAALAGRPSSAG